MPAKLPTAMQFGGLVQETPPSSLVVDPGLGVLTRLQFVLFQASARLKADSPVGSVEDPTAMQFAVPGQETAEAGHGRATRGFGLGCTLHPVPFRLVQGERTD